MKTSKIELTYDQNVKIRMFLLMSTNYRKGERETWEQLSNEFNEDGSLKFKNAKSNAEWYADLEKTINEVLKILDDAI